MTTTPKWWSYKFVCLMVLPSINKQQHMTLDLTRQLITIDTETVLLIYCTLLILERGVKFNHKQHSLNFYQHQGKQGQPASIDYNYCILCSLVPNLPNRLRSHEIENYHFNNIQCFVTKKNLKYILEVQFMLVHTASVPIWVHKNSKQCLIIKKSLTCWFVRVSLSSDP